MKAAILLRLIAKGVGIVNSLVDMHESATFLKIRIAEALLDGEDLSAEDLEVTLEKARNAIAKARED